YRPPAEGRRLWRMGIRHLCLGATLRPAPSPDVGGVRRGARRHSALVASDASRILPRLGVQLQQWDTAERLGTGSAGAQPGAPAADGRVTGQAWRWLAGRSTPRPPTNPC